ncbi:hypothetical protein PSCICO_47780 [Pseudomonas cichorii]|uniref:hypothetical protein n=1 Tax=Pseudomonas cichorii TaxID=36746 RepID=UPI0019102E79|nr:hypothetical protein [Pseudomonas cichorii]GFM89379.1 hypothetical protein PSCICO_47780 [Pseudomonas cichorii]
MHQTISQRRAILEGLRQRCTLSTAEFYDKTGRFNPATLPRFNVVPAGGNQFGIVERSTGVVKEVCTGHNAACKTAQHLEQVPAQKPKASFAVLMLRWTAILCVIIALFAFYGSHP